MITLLRRIPNVILRIYTVAALLAAVILAPLALSVIPVIILMWYVFQWRRRMRPLVGLLSEWIAFMSIALLLSQAIGVLWSSLVATPVLLLAATKLEEFAALGPGPDRGFNPGQRSLTKNGISLGSTAGVLLLVAMLVGNPSLLVTCLASLLALGGLAIASWLGFARKPVVERPITQRMIAGSQASCAVEFGVEARTGGRIFLEPAYDWVKINPSELPLHGSKLVATINLSPTLSGPGTVKLAARAIDRWGLVETDFELEPLRLEIIPRARYAAWLVQKYMAGSRSGTLALFANIGTIKPLHGWRRGIEYYGSRLYQPGDSLKNIDWKHSLEHGELTAKEFAEFGGRPAVLLVNLVAKDAEQADKLAASVASTALSLAREGIPAAIAAYDSNEVKLTTAAMGPERLLSCSLQVIRQLTTAASPWKYLSPPDVGRLRGNIMRLGSVHSPASEVLSRLLKSEYENLKRASLASTAWMALAQVMRKVDKESNVIVISSVNVDADALEFAKFSLRQRGNHVMELDI